MNMLKVDRRRAVIKSTAKSLTFPKFPLFLCPARKGRSATENPYLARPVPLMLILNLTTLGEMEKTERL
jgi:hypothetical protein